MSRLVSALVLLFSLAACSAEDGVEACEAPDALDSVGGRCPAQGPVLGLSFPPVQDSAQRSFTLAKAEALVFLRRYREAVQSLESVSSFVPGLETHPGLYGTSDEALYEAAIKAYEAYLDTADIPPEVRANILYRVGQIYDERLADYENALATFIRIRELYPQTTICKDARKRIVECLEALNRSGDAQRQMRSVAELGGEKEKETAAGPVVAKIGERTITMGELDREIEKLPKQVQLQFRDRAKKGEFLKQYVFTELLYDMGKRKGYENDKEIRRQVRDYEKQAIVGKVYKEEIAY